MYMSRAHEPVAMTDETAARQLSPGTHRKAAEAFVDRTRSRFGDDIDEFYKENSASTTGHRARG